MERAFPFVVISLLQLCRAEIQNAIPEWYSANLINDAEYSPKPLTEIFSTDSTFTSKIPEAVSQTITQAVSTQTLPESIVTLPTTTFREIPSTNFDNSNNQQQTAQNMQRSDVITSRMPDPPTPQMMSQINQNNQPRTQTGTFPNQRPRDFLIVVDPEQPGSTVWPTQSPIAQETSFSFQTTLSLSQGNNDQTSIAPNRNMAGNTRNTNSFINGPTSMSTVRPTNITGFGNQNPTLRIRVKSAKGSKQTNILINSSSSSTLSSTTRRPSTRRRQGGKRNNNYELCLDSCKGSKDPICGRPVQLLPIDTDTFKGFASLCHMACHNNYRRDQYEKVADGRCGKLRTRIKLVDKDKLNRNDLNKSQYSVVHNGPETVIEFSPLSSKK